MMALPDGRKSFKIGLAIYRRVTATQPAGGTGVSELTRGFDSFRRQLKTFLFSD